MLRLALILLCGVAGLGPAAGAATAAVADAEPGTAPSVADSLEAAELNNLLDLGLAGRDAWYVRGFDSLFAREDPGVGDAARETTAPIDAAFRPYAGHRIRQVVILGRQAFGTLVPDTTDTVVEDAGDTLQTSTSTFTRFLNAVTSGTRDFKIRHYLRFRAGDRLDPDALADSERLLRDLAFTSDAKIEVVPVPGWTGAVDVFVLVRDRWPLGASLKIHTQDRYDVKVFHRNVGGVGLDLECEIPYERGRTPETGWRARAALANVAGSFVDLDVQIQRVWSRDRDAILLERDFVHPDIRLVGGVGLIDEKLRDHPDLPADRHLQTGVRDLWLGWGFRLRDGLARNDRRVRLVPALRAERIDYVNPPLDYAAGERRWRDVTRYFAQLSLVGVDYYTARLVYGYGETEDLPSGPWLALVGGYESGEAPDRLYHGAHFLWPNFAGGDRYVALGLGLGGYRRGGRFEDGVLDLFLGGFAPLRRYDYGAWRHFYGLSYTLGINRNQPGGLRLDRVALRDLDDASVSGEQRLAAEAESVLFTRYALLGFKVAAFGYVAGGFLGDEHEFIAARRLNLDVSLGLRLNNPHLVFPTIELRAGVLNTTAGTEPVLSVSMGDLNFLRRRVPSVKPGTVPYL